mmetsp:Transcript_15507/g.39421  ORF Transcript_15507/g.39421 Transcript_15507/m.39421 type:complete len:233 (+) Transcript_15507:405-1103(+)
MSEGALLLPPFAAAMATPSPLDPSHAPFPFPSPAGAAAGVPPLSPLSFSLALSGVLKLDESHEKKRHFSSCRSVAFEMFQSRLTGRLGCRGTTWAGQPSGHSWKAKYDITMPDTSSHFTRTLPTLHTSSSGGGTGDNGAEASPPSPEEPEEDPGGPAAPPLPAKLATTFLRSSLDSCLLLNKVSTSPEDISSSPLSPTGGVAPFSGCKAAPVAPPPTFFSSSTIKLESSFPQ